MADKHKKHHETEEPVEAVTEESKEEQVKESAPSKGGKFARLWQWALTHKKFSLPAAVVLLLALLAAVPHTRYALAGLVLKQQYQVAVVDMETGKPVSSATVMLDGKKTLTDNRGRASIKASVGFAKLEVSKKYYESASQEVVVPIQKPDSPKQVELKATGRPVELTVVNKITKKPIANIAVKSADTEVKTDKDGKATMVVPANKEDLAVTLSGEGYISTDSVLVVAGANNFEMVSTGTIYFLSNASGKIDLVKSNLDGGDRKIVLAGTGKEDRYNTVLLASRDWKYIALLSKRDGGAYSKLFLIETGNDTVTTMDEGQADFTIIGWSGDRFVYTVTRQKIPSWQPKRQALKSYSASSKKITLLDETSGEGNQYEYVYQQYQDVVVLDQEVVFTKNWYVVGPYCYYSQYNTNGKQITFNSIKADGGQKKVVKGYAPQAPCSASLETRIAEFGEVYIRYTDASGKPSYEAYKGGKLTAEKLTDDEYYSTEYPSYAVSPSGNKTLWSDYRDGKNVFFVGDGNGENGTQIGSSDEFTVYGWFTDDYLLITKKGSEMRILPASDLEGDLNAALKVTDYYKPNYYLRGFGYGYGG